MTKGYETKKNPFIELKAVIRQSKAPYIKFKSYCSIWPSRNGKINAEIISWWVNDIVGKLSFGKNPLELDIQECHMMYQIKKQLHKIKVESIKWLKGAISL